MQYTFQWIRRKYTCVLAHLESTRVQKEEKRGRNKGSIMLAMGKSVWGIHRFYLYYSYSCNFSVGLKLFQNKEFIKIVRDE